MLLTVCLCLPVLAMPVVATDERAKTIVTTEATEPYSCVLPAANGHMYYELTNAQSICVMTNIDKNTIEVNIVNVSEPEVVHRWVLSDYDTNAYNTQDFWDSIIQYANSHVEEAQTIMVKHGEVDESKGGALIFLWEEFNTMIESEYYDVLKYTANKNGETMRIYETHVPKIELWDSLTWSDGVTIGGLISTLLGVEITNTLVQCIAKAFDVIMDVSSLLPERSKLEQYRCSDHYFRYTTVNGSKYAYNITDKYTDYFGYDAPNQVGIPNIDHGSKETWYSQNATYYRSYSSQVNDAYEMFLDIGQMA